ncbi:hypothetical protein [Pantoea ananatis]|uniref:hypothetical protein n=1 Tax=Pantoea ananas TaxID=553 RepID=UPI001B30FCD8|nr:hypothetical protein [Pantoea ananatis]
MHNMFLEWLRWAIDNVEEGYYSHSERVYCYELYHLIRVRMYFFEKNGGNLNGIYLNNEIVKRMITQEEARFFNVDALDGQRIPDFLFHTPGNFDNQIATMEVKKADLTTRDLLDDIMKINQMMDRYNYQLGIFHVINNSLERVMDIVNNQRNTLRNMRGDILFIIKPGFGHESHEFRLEYALR